MWRFLAFSSLFLSLGCSSGPAPVKLYPVKGKVTMAGKPLTGCNINLATENPAKGVDGQYAGKLNDNGEFTITTEKGQSGAPAGKFKVTFALSPDDAMKAMKGGGAKPGYQASAFPPEYSSAKTSKKEVEIKPEPNELLIEIP